VREKPGRVGLEERFSIIDEREADLYAAKQSTPGLPRIRIPSMAYWTLPQTSRNGIGCVGNTCLKCCNRCPWPLSVPQRTTADSRSPSGAYRSRTGTFDAGRNGTRDLRRLPARHHLSRRGGFRRPDPPGARLAGK